MKTCRSWSPDDDGDVNEICELVHRIRPIDSI